MIGDYLLIYQFLRLLPIKDDHVPFHGKIPLVEGAGSTHVDVPKRLVMIDRKW